MGSPEVDFILQAIKDNLTGAGGSGAGYYGAGHDSLDDIPIQRIDRDDAKNLETGERVMAGKDYTNNYVGARTAETQAEAIGTEYDQRVQAVVNVRLSGTHHAQHGQIDPDGNNGAVWTDLRDGVKLSIMHKRKFPAVGGPATTTYTWIDRVNEQDLSSDFKDKYRWEADFAFVGFEEEP